METVMFEAISTHYLWWILALLLIAGELLLPGYFLLWIGIAAAAMGVVLWVVPTLGMLAQAIGQRYELIEPIINGRGKARVGDGQWLVSGPDLPAGSTVEVVAVQGTTLKVRAAA